jgi:signal transduction histidine kinase
MGRGLDLAARRKDGTEFPVEISLSFVSTRGGPLVIALITDITQRKLGERRLRTEFAITRLLAEQPALAEAAPRLLQALCESLGWELGELWLVDPGAGVLRWSGSWHSPAVGAAEFTAFSRSVTFARSVGIPGLVWASGQPMWVPDLTRETCFLRADQARRIGLRAACAFPVRSRQDITAVIVFFCRELRQPDPELVSLLTDVMTRIGLYLEFRRSEEDREHQRELLLQREKLAALGTLAAGLAHEINNPIGIISSRIELMLLESEGTDLAPKLRQDIEVLHRHAQRVGRIAEGLLSFVRQPSREWAPVDLNHVVEETLLLVGKAMSKAGIRLSIALGPGLPPVAGHASSLQQVVLNLITNARDAIDGHGTIRIETRIATDRPDAIQLAVADTGRGILGEEISRIFEPFFTTKSIGTGLGLSITRSIVQEHRGTIDVDSSPGQGTRFVLTFPVAPPA